MEFIINKKIKLYNCEDLFIIEDIDNNKLFVKKIKSGNKFWISTKKVEKIYE